MLPLSAIIPFDIIGSLEIFFLVLLLSFIHASGSCSISNCWSDNIPVRFPFQLEGLQPQNCGYPGFNLSCNNQGKTVLKLPYSGDFLVRSINYLAQQIQIYDSENCLPKRLLNFNLSGSPFVAAAYQNYTFLSCPTQLVESRFTTIDCLRNSTTSVLAMSSKSIAESLTLSTSCRIIITLPIPVSWPVDYDESFSSDLKNDVQLTWYSPACQDCEEQGGMCGFKTNASKEIGCFYYSKKTGRSTIALQMLRVICLSIAIPCIILAAGISTFAFLIERNRPDAPRAIQNANAAAVSPQPTIAMVGLDGDTIESYEKVVLGDSMRLPAGPNDSTCAICLSQYHSKETLRCIPECKHCFHVECIDEWLRMNSSCPVCRNKPSPDNVISLAV